MRRTDLLIALIRKLTRNEDYSATNGIPQDVFCQYLSDAQDMLQGALFRNCPSIDWFDKQYTFNVVALQRNYPLPTDVYYGSNVKYVEFTRITGQIIYYTQLRVLPFNELSVWQTWPPDSYSISNSQVFLSPHPNNSQGNVRVTYPARLPKLDLPRGTIASVAAGPVRVVLNNDSFLDATNIGLYVPGTLSITNAAGAWIASIAATTYVAGTFTLTGPITYQGSYTSADLPGCFLTFQDYSTCVPQLPIGIPELERYLIAYTTWKIFQHDSSNDAEGYGNSLSAIENDIIKAVNAATQEYPMVYLDGTDW